DEREERREGERQGTVDGIGGARGDHAAAPRAASRGAGLESWDALEEIAVRARHGLRGIGPGLCAHFETRTLAVVVSMWMIQNTDTSSRLTVATRPVPGAKR